MHTVGTEVNDGSAADLHAPKEQHANNEHHSARQYACVTLVPKCIALVCESCCQSLRDPNYERFGSTSLLHVLLCSLAQIDRHIYQRLTPLACFDWDTHLDSATGCIQLIVAKAAICGANLQNKSNT